MFKRKEVTAFFLTVEAVWGGGMQCVGGGLV